MRSSSLTNELLGLRRQRYDEHWFGVVYGAQNEEREIP